eukprot:274987_1
METYLTGVLQYNSVRFLRVKNWKLAVVYWLLLATVLSYVIIFTIVVEKGYQTHDEAIGNVATKVKGTASTGDYYNWTNAMVFDAMDLIHPPIESNALFIATSYVTTPLQTRGTCNGNEDIGECTADTDCEYNDYNWKSQGILTGKCGSNGRCQVSGWCPLEDDSIRTVFNNVGSFTVFVKNDIRFPNFNIEVTNARDYEGTGRLTFGKNLFSINDMLRDATNGEVNASQIATKGAILLVDIDWTCNFDQGYDECMPQFNFERIDNEGDGIVSEGYNFRTVVYENNSTLRELKKLYGVRITFTSSGRGGQFSMLALSITLGAGIAYLGVAKIVTDLVLSYFLPQSKKYKEAKYLRVHAKKLLFNRQPSSRGVDVKELEMYVDSDEKEKEDKTTRQARVVSDSTKPNEESTEIICE